MSYTPTTWSTGDTITASAMNKIENGIANASGGQIPLLVVSRSGGTSYSLSLFMWGIAKYENGAYTLCDYAYTPIQYVPGGNYTSMVYTAPYPIPISDDLFLVVYQFGSTYDILSQSGINTTPITVTNNGVSYSAYIVTGDYYLSIYCD